MRDGSKGLDALPGDLRSRSSPESGQILAAVCSQRRAGDEAGIIGCEKDDAARDLLGLAQSPDRDVRQDVLLKNVLRYHLDHFVCDIAATYCVDGNAALGAFLR